MNSRHVQGWQVPDAFLTNFVRNGRYPLSSATTTHSPRFVGHAPKIVAGTKFNNPPTATWRWLNLKIQCITDFPFPPTPFCFGELLFIYFLEDVFARRCSIALFLEWRFRGFLLSVGFAYQDEKLECVCHSTSNGWSRICDF